MATDCLFKIPLELKEPIVNHENRYITHINVPCGKCGRCIERRKMEWGFRVEKEMEVSKNAYFVTLTYSPETVPYDKYGNKTLKPKDLTDFFKRLRQNQKRSKTTIEHYMYGLTKKDKIKYYACGEYGEEKGRPHYHAIIFNVSDRNIIKSWELGETHVVAANSNTIAYVMKYLDKQHNKEKEWKKTPEYNTMSEGLGEHYINKNKTWHKKNIDILYVTTQRGIKIPMPKYYRDKIFSEEDRKDQVLIVINKLEETKKDFIKLYGEDEYNKNQAKLKKETERRFRKKIKKRLVD